MTDTAPSLGDLFEFYLAQKRPFDDATRSQARKLNSTGIPVARASSLGNCLLAQWLEGKGAPTRPNDDPDTLRTFDNGSTIADRVVQAISDLGLLAFGPTVHGGETYLHDDDINLAGHVDCIMQWPPVEVDEMAGTVVELNFLEAMRAKLAEEFPGVPDGYTVLDELKTTNPFSFKYSEKDDAEAKEGHIIQAGSYIEMARLHPDQMPRGRTFDEARVSYWSYGGNLGKIPLSSVSFTLDMDVAAKAARQRAITLRDAWANDTVPNCECKSEGKLAWTTEFCSLSDIYAVDDEAGTVTFQCCVGSTYQRRIKSKEVLRSPWKVKP